MTTGYNFFGLDKGAIGAPYLGKVNPVTSFLVFSHPCYAVASCMRHLQLVYAEQRASTTVKQFLIDYLFNLFPNFSLSSIDAIDREKPHLETVDFFKNLLSPRYYKIWRYIFASFNYDLSYSVFLNALKHFDINFNKYV